MQTSNDLILVAQVVDRLRGDPELHRDLGDRLAGLDQIQHLAAELDLIPPRHDDLLIVNARNSSSPDRAISRADQLQRPLLGHPLRSSIAEPPVELRAATHGSVREDEQRDVD